MNAIPRMRTIKQAISELKAKDSQTAFTETALRRAILSGQIPHIRAGNKILVNLDIVENYLSGTLDGSVNASEAGQIRALS